MRQVTTPLTAIFPLPEDAIRICWVLPDFPGVFQSESFRRQPRTSKHRGTRVGAPRGLSTLRHRFGRGFPHKRRDFVPEIQVGADATRIFSAFCPFPEESTPKRCHPKSQHPRRFGKRFSQWVLWVLNPGLHRCCWMPLFLC